MGYGRGKRAAAGLPGKSYAPNFIFFISLLKTNCFGQKEQGLGGEIERYKNNQWIWIYSKFELISLAIFRDSKFTQV